MSIVPQQTISITNLPPIKRSVNFLILAGRTYPPPTLPVPILPQKQYFVYTLVRPDGRVFYVGKGKDDRPFEHFGEARRKECHCRRCEIIRGVWRIRRRVIVNYIFETDDAREALDRERQAITELSHVYLLCNKQGRMQPEPPPWKRLNAMNFDEISAYFDWLDLPPKQRKERIQRWADERMHILWHEWRRLRSMRDFEGAEEVGRELDTLEARAGKIWQERLPMKMPPRADNQRPIRKVN